MLNIPKIPEEILKRKVCKTVLKHFPRSPALSGPYTVVSSRSVESVDLSDVLLGPLAAHRPLPLAQAALPGEHGAAYDEAAQGQVWILKN